MFILKHQDGDIEYAFERGGFAVVDSKLYLSVEIKAESDESFPDCYKFALDGYPINGKLVNSNFQISTNPDDEPPNVYVYTTFHACKVEADISIEVISENEVSISLNVMSEDVNYYNEKAKPNPLTGKITLENKPLGDMWIPS